MVWALVLSVKNQFKRGTHFAQEYNIEVDEIYIQGLIYAGNEI